MSNEHIFFFPLIMLGLTKKKSLKYLFKIKSLLKVRCYNECIRPSNTAMLETGTLSVAMVSWRVGFGRV